MSWGGKIVERINNWLEMRTQSVGIRNQDQVLQPRDLAIQYFINDNGKDGER